VTPESIVGLAPALPAVAAVLIAASHRAPNLREAVTLGAATALFAAVASLLPQVLDGGRPGLFLLELFPGLALELRVEPFGLMFALIASGLWVLSSVYSIGYMRHNGERHQTRFYVCFALALASTIGVAFSGNLLTLFLFYEALTLVTYPLVTHHGDDQARRGGRTYLGVLLFTSTMLLFPAIVATWIIAGTLDFVQGGILEGRISAVGAAMLLLLYVFGIGKAALMPMHRWRPAAMVAPTPVSALLHAVAVVKAGVFSVVKVVVYIFGLDAMGASFAWLPYVAGFTILAASVIALHSDNLNAASRIRRSVSWPTWCSRPHCSPRYPSWEQRCTWRHTRSARSPCSLRPGPSTPRPTRPWSANSMAWGAGCRGRWPHSPSHRCR
jgi:multicomponent Na+:H+ antiporter subunit D